MMQYPGIPIILYTARVNSLMLFLNSLMLFNGITLTIHENSDIGDFNEIMEFVAERQFYIDFFLKKTMRLNVFNNVNFDELRYTEFWTIKKNIEWIKNCPLPKGEVFMRIKDYD